MRCRKNIIGDAVNLFPVSFYLCAVSDEACRDKLTLIYDKYLDDMSRLAAGYVGKYQAQGDVVHNAVLKIIDNLDKIELSDEKRTRGYIWAITRSCAIDWLRREKRFETENIDDYQDTIECDEPPPVEVLMSREGYDYLVGCIRSMKDSYRNVCELKFMCGLKEREIAEQLGLSEKNVSVIIVRGRRKLTEMLERYRKNDK